MQTEIERAVDFLTSYIEKHPSIPRDKLEGWRGQLQAILKQRFQSHWDTDNVIKGNGYRAITFLRNELDFVLLEACKTSGVSSIHVTESLPRELVLWIDPYNVSYRSGDHMNVITIYEDRSHGKLSLLMQQRAKSKVKVTISKPPAHMVGNQTATTASNSGNPPEDASSTNRSGTAVLAN
jgi:protein Tob/BTG